MQTEKKLLEETRKILDEVESACNDFGLSSLKKTVKSIQNFTEQNQYLDVAVLGSFKAGKSSFLNSLIQRPLLPVGNIPVTSVITRIRYGRQEKATVSFLDGTSREIPIDEIQDFVSESGNPGNERDVFSVDIEVPTLEDFKAIRLVDTPGIGSVWQHNTETTTGWFPETGGVLFLISAERAISESELNFLKETYLYTPEIAVVITKVDLFGEDQLKDIEAFTAEVLKRNFKGGFPIYRHSAYQNADRYNRELKEKVLFPLAQNRIRVFFKILSHKMSTLVEACISYLEIGYEASTKMEAEKQKIKEIILDQHLNSHFVRRELTLIIASYKEKTRESLRTYFEAFRSGIELKIIDEYNTAFETFKGNLYEVTRQFEKWLAQALHTELSEILAQEEKSFELLNAVKKHLSFYLKSFRERLSENLERVLGVKMRAEEWEMTLGEMKKPNISISRSFDFHLDLLWFFFPMFIFKNVFRRYFLKQIPYEVEKNIHRLTSNLTERINKEMDNLLKQALAYINEELRMVESLLSEGRGDSSYIRERINRLKATNYRLCELYAHLTLASGEGAREPSARSK
ncbi:MAG: dynamin family protein [Syntrophothermus sp.]|uniref:dynamin family protein n=1 Tax=Syntrophothermus sp. TaxID=2736299 RepID=UPI00257C3CC3|nr:dynamin family protein [Syntrophothermus sp.]NSW82809.1 dynamin family protein [Syntrophothermus sp.]